MGPALADAGPYTAAAGRPLSHGLLPPKGGAPLLPYARRPPRDCPRAIRSRLRGAAARRGRVAAHKARPAWSMVHRRARGAGAWAGTSADAAVPNTKGHGGSAAGPRCPAAPPQVAPGCQVLVPQDRRAGAAALSSWLGRACPASQALPDSGPPAACRCMPPPPPPRHGAPPPPWP